MTVHGFETIWSLLPFPAFIIDKNIKITTANIAAETFCSTSFNQMANRPLEKFVGEGAVLLDIVAQVQAGMRSVVLHDVDLGWGQESRGVVNIQATGLPDENEVLLLLHPRGIAEKMDRSLAHQSAARSVTGMAAMLAHEIRNPLAGISGAAQLLATNAPPEDQELAQMIQDETKRIGDLVDRAEGFGDLRPSEKSAVNIHDVLERAKRAAMAGFANHMRFIEVYDPSLPPVRGNADQLMQVLQNLLKNAAEAAPNGANITLKTAYRPGVKLTVSSGNSRGLPIQITVSDTGPGIPSNLKDSIFDPFISTKPNGSGLGLSMISKIVADHDGVIEFNSSGQGTTFQILLPVWQQGDS